MLTTTENQTPEILNQARAKFRRIEVLDNYGMTWLVQLLTLEIHAASPITGIVALSEVDLIRAAQLRQKLGVLGQSVESAVAFRDK